MNRTAAAPSPLQISLRRGPTQWLHAQPGTVLTGLAGRFTVIEAPRWIGDTAWQARVPVDAGQAHALRSGGWVQLSATTDAELLCLQPAPTAPAAGLAAAWRNLTRRIFSESFA